MKRHQQKSPTAAPRGSAVRTALIAAAVGVAGAAGVAGVAVGVAATSARQPHGHGGGGGHGHAQGVREHYQMVQGPNGPAAAKEAMLRMAAHQYLLGEAAADPELKRLAATPELRKAIDEVKAALKDHAALNAKKAELLQDHDQMLMIVAHALLKQDAEVNHMLKDAEMGRADH